MIFVTLHNARYNQTQLQDPDDNWAQESFSLDLLSNKDKPQKGHRDQFILWVFAALGMMLS